MLSPEERHLLLESYKEQTVSWRHHDQLFQRFTSIILPVSFTALVVPFVKDGVPKSLPIVGGVMLMLFWLFYSEIAAIKTRVHFELIHEIERRLEMYGHKDWAEKRKERRSSWIGIRRLHWGIFGIYILASIVLYWDPCNWFPLPKNGMAN